MDSVSMPKRVTGTDTGNRSTSALVQEDMTALADGQLPPGTYLGTYELVRLLAQGGMADIYLAKNLAAPTRFVAVKVLSARRATDPESRALFADEARLVGMLDHLNLAGILEVDVDAGVHYLVMDYVHGADLREILAFAAATDRAIPYDCALTIIAAAAAGLEHAHTRCDDDGNPLALVHRDVSLSNIMVGHDGSVKVIDFGIAQSAQAIHVTNPGIVRGKASYMSPEQCLGDAIDLRTDVFALGVVLYELTTGRRCFQGQTDFERMLAVVRGEWVPPSIHIPEFPHALERVIRTALALDPAHRYPSAAAMIEAIEQVAALEGWMLGSRTTARFMCELFGCIAFPSVTEDESATVLNPPNFEELAAAIEAIEAEMTPAETRIISKRRLARGTHVDGYEPESTELADMDDLFDDVPTRGRRSAPRVWNSFAA
jgi:eukaryotic-like serine/threonine-protein kinase